ncbi:hypothetical protein Tco_0665993 [Tanacetum coccineum]
MVGRHRARNVNQLNEELDPRDIEVNELRQPVQQLQPCLERVEAPRQNHNEPENEDYDEEYNPFHCTSYKSVSNNLEESVELPKVILEANDNVKVKTEMYAPYNIPPLDSD